LAFSLALASCTFLAWLVTVALLFCEEALVVTMDCELGVAIVSSDLKSDFGLMVSFVLNLIVDTDSLAGVSLA